MTADQKQAICLANAMGCLAAIYEAKDEKPEFFRLMAVKSLRYIEIVIREDRLPSNEELTEWLRRALKRELERTMDAATPASETIQ